MRPDAVLMASAGGVLTSRGGGICAIFGRFDAPLPRARAEAARAQAAEAEDDGPTEASKAIAALGLTRMSLQELKDKPPVDLLAFARGSAGKSGAEAQAAFRNRFREHFHDAATAALPRPLTIFNALQVGFTPEAPAA